MRSLEDVFFSQRHRGASAETPWVQARSLEDVFFSRKGAKAPWVQAQSLKDVFFLAKAPRCKRRDTMGASAKLEGCFFFSQRREGAEFEGCFFSRKDFSQRRKGAKGASAKFGGCFFLAEAQVLRFKRG